MRDTAHSAPSSTEARVQALAYALWLEEGRPEGRAEAHWFKAQQLVNTVVPASVATTATKTKKPAARKKAAK